MLITVRNSSCGKVIFSQVSVYSQRGGVQPPWPDRHLPWADTPWPGRHPHPGRWPPHRTVRILLECILVCIQFGTQIRRVLPKTSSVTTITLSVTSQSFLCVFFCLEEISVYDSMYTVNATDRDNKLCNAVDRLCRSGYSNATDHERIALLCLVQ